MCVCPAASRERGGAGTRGNAISVVLGLPATRTSPPSAQQLLTAVAFRHSARPPSTSQLGTMHPREDQHPRVSQASGMVSVQAACTVGEALELMKTRAFLDGQTLTQIADATLERSIHFAPPA